MPTAIPPEERLTNLVVALMATQIGLTRRQIFEAVSGYRQRVEQGVKQASLEKMFERDKDELRGLGIPIETIGEASDPNDLRDARYRIPQSEYVLPEDLELSSAELAVLSLAAGVWREGSLSADAASGLRKIRALGIDVDEPIIGIEPDLDLPPAAFAPLQRAIEHREAVTFDYLMPGASAPLRRSVTPLALVEAESRWHLFGIDTDRDAERTFLLSRIVSDVTGTGAGFDAALLEDAGARALTGLQSVLRRNVAHLEVEPASEAALRLARRGRPASQGLDVPYLDAEIFADELASYGPEVRVLTPADLRDRVIERLRAVVAAHAAPASVTGSARGEGEEPA